jgi:hypothetical protein
MIRWLLGLYYARLRRLDLELLWPEIRERAASITHARMAFAVHVSRDPAWLFLGADKVDQIVWGLT